jgi:hypothetical protein
MPVVSIVCGALLVALGVWAKYSTGTESVTALIPAFFGAPLILLGLVALKESLLKHAMHAAAMIGLLGFLAGVGNLIRVALKPDADLTSTPAMTTVKMTVVCAAFVALCVNSFIQARRRRAAREAAGQP